MPRVVHRGIGRVPQHQLGVCFALNGRGLRLKDPILGVQAAQIETALEVAVGQVVTGKVSPGRPRVDSAGKRDIPGR